MREGCLSHCSQLQLSGSLPALTGFTYIHTQTVTFEVLSTTKVGINTWPGGPGSPSITHQWCTAFQTLFLGMEPIATLRDPLQLWGEGPPSLFPNTPPLFGSRGWAHQYDPTRRQSTFHTHFTDHTSNA